MVQRNLSLRLDDIVTAIDRVTSVVSKIDFDAYNNRFEAQWLVERGVEIISEASRHIPPERTQQFQNVPWGDIRSIGNRLRHGYETLDPYIMWTIATLELPRLRVAIVDMRHDLPDEEPTP